MPERHEAGEGSIQDVLLMSQWRCCVKKYVTGEEDLFFFPDKKKTVKCNKSTNFSVYVDFM